MTTLELPICYNDATYIRVAERALTRPSAVAQRSDPMDVHDLSTLPPETIERFWSNVDRSAGPDACWPWTGALDQRGYGLFYAQGQRFRANRVALILGGQALTRDLFACHHCDNPACCNNVACLFAGTAAENMADRDAKGRQARGQRHGWHTMPETRPVGSRNGTHTQPETRALGARNGMWTHPEARLTGERNGFARLTDDAVLAIRSDYQLGDSKKGLARRYGVSDRTIRRVVNGEAWMHLAAAAALTPADDAGAGDAS